MELQLQPIKLAGLTCLLMLSALPVGAKELRLSYADELKPLLALTDPQFDRMQGVFRVTLANSGEACPGASISLVDGEQIQRFEMEEDGRVEVPIEQGLADRGAQLLLRKPDSAPSCQILTNVTAKLPAGREWRYRDLVAFGEQLQAFVKRGAGMISLFAPKLRGLTIRFEGDATAHLIIRASSGEIVLRSSAGELHLPIDERLAEDNPVVSLSAPVLSMDGWLDE